MSKDMIFLAAAALFTGPVPRFQAARDTRVEAHRAGAGKQGSRG